MEKLLLHACCAPCAVYPASMLKHRFDITLFFYGPNIFPREEYDRRLKTAEKAADTLGLIMVEAEYDDVFWAASVKGFEEEPEGGKRCTECYRVRVERAAKYAKENGYHYFSTTLTVSPHKPARIINPIGEEIAKKYGLVFLAEDYKKQDGFKKSCQMSREYGLYRQKYCGCKYSCRL